MEARVRLLSELRSAASQTEQMETAPGQLRLICPTISPFYVLELIVRPTARMLLVAPLVYRESSGYAILNTLFLSVHTAKTVPHSQILLTCVCQLEDVLPIWQHFVRCKDLSHRNMRWKATPSAELQENNLCWVSSQNLSPFLCGNCTLCTTSAVQTCGEY
jgi:hypothetical protein